MFAVVVACVAESSTVVLCRLLFLFSIFFSSPFLGDREPWIIVRSRDLTLGGNRLTDGDSVYLSTFSSSSR